MKHEILPWKTFTLVSKIHCLCFSSIKAFAEKWYRIKFNRKDIVQKIQKYQNVSEWNHVRKPGATNVHANILTIAALFWNECRIMLLIIHWLSCNYILADTDNSDTAAGEEFIRSHRRCCREEHFWRTSERLLLRIDFFIIYWFLQYTFFICENRFFFMTQLKQ